MGPLEWIGEQAENAWSWVEGKAEGLWHEVVEFVNGVVHGVTGWLVGLFGVVIWAWHRALSAAETVAEGIGEFAGEIGSFIWTFVTHTLPHIWRWIEHTATAAWHWVEGAVKWAAQHIAHLAASAWHWVENALKWVNNHVLRPLEHLASYVWNHLTKWAHDAWELLTHPLKLAAILFWPLWFFFEHVAWQVARTVGKWLAEVVLHNMLKVVHLVEDVLAAVL